MAIQLSLEPMMNQTVSNRDTVSLAMECMDKKDLACFVFDKIPLLAGLLRINRAFRLRADRVKEILSDYQSVAIGWIALTVVGFFILLCQAHIGEYSYQGIRMKKDPKTGFLIPLDEAENEKALIRDLTRYQ